MTEVLHSSPSSSPSSLSCAPSSTLTHNDALFRTQSSSVGAEQGGDGEEEGNSRVTGGDEVKERDKDRDQLSLLALLVTLFRKSLLAACKTDREELCGMEIGWPTNVRHVAHVTFDRFNGFLGLPVEFEPEVPRRAPSASATVFGVSTESMQLSYDPRGNSVPTILLLMQRHLYGQGGLQAEGIFRINAENSQEEYVRDHLNRGVVPEGIDVHCLAGLIKAWFRELPIGVLDSLSPEQIMQCQSEEDCTALVRLLPQTEAALLDWAVNLMADIVQQEHLNKMNAHNIAMVFAPNMTQYLYEIIVFLLDFNKANVVQALLKKGSQVLMADPLTALMYAVQVMNFLKTLIVKTVHEREDPSVEPSHGSGLEPSDESGHDSPSHPHLEEVTAHENDKTERCFVAEEPVLDSTSDSNDLGNVTDGEAHSDSTFTDESYEDCNPAPFNRENGGLEGKTGQSSILNFSKGPGIEHQPMLLVMGNVEKSKELSNLSRINSRTERIEAWW